MFEVSWLSIQEFRFESLGVQGLGLRALGSGV